MNCSNPSLKKLESSIDNLYLEKVSFLITQLINFFLDIVTFQKATSELAYDLQVRYYLQKSHVLSHRATIS